MNGRRCVDSTHRKAGTNPCNEIGTNLLDKPPYQVMHLKGGLFSAHLSPLAEACLSSSVKKRSSELQKRFNESCLVTWLVDQLRYSAFFQNSVFFCLFPLLSCAICHHSLIFFLFFKKNPRSLSKGHVSLCCMEWIMCRVACFTMIIACHKTRRWIRTLTPAVYGFIYFYV